MNFKKIVRSLLKVILILVGVVVLLAVFLNWWAIMKEKDLAGRRGAPEDFAKRFPRTEVNSSALKLEELTARIGIDLAPRDALGRNHPTTEAVKAFDEIKAEMGDFLDAQLQKPNDETDAPPEKVRQYLESHEAHLSEIKNHIASEDLPRWETDVGKLWEAPIPNLLGQMQLQKLFAVEVLNHFRSNEIKKAEETLEVSWKLNRSVQQRPELICQLIGIAVARIQAGVLRKAPSHSPDWRVRLKENDYRKQALTSFELEHWILQTSVEQDKFLDAMGIDKLFLQLGKPYLRLCAADFLEKHLAVIEELKKQDPCSLDPSGAKDFDMPFGEWNVLGQMIWSNPAGSWTRVSRLLIDLELTEKILQIREMQSAEGVWPAQVPGIDSSACADEKWVYSVSSEGTMSISFSRNPQWPGVTGLILPLSFSARRQQVKNE